MLNDLSVGVDVSIVPTDHAERHGVVGSLGNVLHLQESLVEVRDLHAHPLCRLAEVAQQKLVLGDPLDGLDKEGRDVVPVTQLLLYLLG